MLIHGDQLGEIKFILIRPSCGTRCSVISKLDIILILAVSNFAYVLVKPVLFSEHHQHDNELKPSFPADQYECHLLSLHTALDNS